jgi:hypothetical protein
MIHNPGWQPARRRKLHKTKGKLGDRCWRKGSYRGKDGMRVGDNVVAAQAAISFGRILQNPKIVGYRYYRKEDQDEDSKSDELRAPVGASMPGVPQPEAVEHHG